MASIGDRYFAEYIESTSLDGCSPLGTAFAMVPIGDRFPMSSICMPVYMYGHHWGLSVLYMGIIEDRCVIMHTGPYGRPLLGTAHTLARRPPLGTALMYWDRPLRK
ncbi:hypothetical protein BDR04DRAFT_1123458 [Suillus decipiens]|nr:hypothetical protein BDR04DRAFT_1123458 [Suillus decipiens]